MGTTFFRHFYVQDDPPSDDELLEVVSDLFTRKETGPRVLKSETLKSWERRHFRIFVAPQVIRIDKPPPPEDRIFREDISLGKIHPWIKVKGLMLKIFSRKVIPQKLAWSSMVCIPKSTK